MKQTVSISVESELWLEFKDLCFDRRTNPSAFIEGLIRDEVGRVGSKEAKARKVSGGAS